MVICVELLGRSVMGKHKKKKQNNSNIFEHQLEEWKYLNSYINQMDLSYQQSFTIMVSIFAGATVLFTSDTSRDLLMGIFIIPPGIVAVFAYISYQFRITAILRGHLAALERKMNMDLGEDVHLWNSALVETFMAHNNSINKYMMVPMFMFIAVIIVYCVIFTWEAVKRIIFGKVVFICYWIMIMIGTLIVLLPFFGNESIRHQTEDEERVTKKYKEYLESRKIKQVI